MRTCVLALLVGIAAVSLMDRTAPAATVYQVTDLGTLGGNASEGTGINSNGNVTGLSYITGGSPPAHAFIYDGSIHDLGTLGGTDSQGFGINNKGEITGNSTTSAGASHAFLYDGTMHDLGTLGGTTSEGDGIKTVA